MVDSLLPLVSPLKALILRIGWKSLELVSSLDIPLLFVSGGKDELVPQSHMRKLFEAASESKIKVI